MSSKGRILAENVSLSINSGFSFTKTPNLNPKLNTRDSETALNISKLPHPWTNFPPRSLRIMQTFPRHPRSSLLPCSSNDQQNSTCTRGRLDCTNIQISTPMHKITRANGPITARRLSRVGLQRIAGALKDTRPAWIAVDRSGGLNASNGSAPPSPFHPWEALARASAFYLLHARRRSQATWIPAAVSPALLDAPPTAAAVASVPRPAARSAAHGRDPVLVKKKEGKRLWRGPAARRTARCTGRHTTGPRRGEMEKARGTEGQTRGWLAGG